MVQGDMGSVPLMWYLVVALLIMLFISTYLVATYEKPQRPYDWDRDI